ncbi:MAG: hypothetical protein AAF363_11420 [Bacteroidota bacterium]
MLESLKAELMEVLRTRLSNKQLDIAIHKVQKVKKDRPYTAKEKMDYFKKKNPAFGEMVKRFGLDAEF